MPYLSIVMPVYGVEKYIATAIESVLSQSFQDWELILVNDGTKDRSRVIAQEYEVKDSRIHIVDKENGGLSDARNVGLQHACGEYVHFFDSDDYISKDYYEELLRDISIRTLDILISGYTVVFHDNQDREQFCEIKGIRYNDIDEFTNEEILVFLDTHFNYAWNKLFRVNFLKENDLLYKKGFYSIEDAEFMGRVIKFSPKIGLCPSVGYHYVNRNRVSLGRCYQREIVDFDASKLEIQKRIADFFIDDFLLVKEWLDRSCLSIYKFLFQSLFNYSKNMSKSDQFLELNYILNNETLVIAIRKTKNLSLFDRFLKSCIIRKNTYAIYVYYKLRSFI